MIVLDNWPIMTGNVLFTLSPGTMKMPWALKSIFSLKDWAYRLVPIKSENKSWLKYGPDRYRYSYNNLINKFVWGGAKERALI